MNKRVIILLCDSGLNAKDDRLVVTVSCIIDCGKIIFNQWTKIIMRRNPEQSLLILIFFFIKFLRFLADAEEWKNLLFVSPSVSQKILERCL